MNAPGNRPRPISLARGAGLLLWLALAAACRSTGGAPAGPALPFHVALIPTAIQDTSVLAAPLSEGEFLEPTGAEPDDDMRLDLSTRALSRGLARELEPSFVRTTVLESPPDPAAFAALGPAQREAYWQARAREVGANLLVRTRLSVGPAIQGERNEKFWLNLPLFLLGGPMCYFVGDRSYEVAARLQAEFFEVSEEHDALADFAVLAIPLLAEFRGTDLNFLERADGLGVYALSLLVPSGLLSSRSPAVEEEVADELAEQLGRELAREVAGQRLQFERNVALGSFRLESEHARFQAAADGRTELQVPLTKLAPTLAFVRVEVFAGATRLADQQLTSQRESPEPLLIRATFLPSPELRYLSILVRDDNAGVRGYTLPVPVNAR